MDHLRHTLDIERNAFSRGLPVHGLELAEDLERLVQLHDASTIAALIVEPIAGSAGVVLPPEGYLRRLRETATARHPVDLRRGDHRLGRVGKAFAAQRAASNRNHHHRKGLSNGSVPMGAGVVSDDGRSFIAGAGGMIEMFTATRLRPSAAAPRRWRADTYAEEHLFRGHELAATGRRDPCLRGLPTW